MSETVVNAVGVELPKFIEGYGEVKPYMGAFATTPTGNKYAPKIKSFLPKEEKLVASLKEAIQKSGLKDGMTISFHHHLRNGDYVLSEVMAEIDKLGIKDLSIIASSLTKAHEDLLGYIRKGVVTSLHTSGLRGKIAEEISKNDILEKPIVFRSHGGRGRVIEAGEVKIDVAFIGAPICDTMGNMNGKEGKSAFGAMGYPMFDALYADTVIAITDNLVPFPLWDISIAMDYIDYVVEVESIGDPSKIATGATRITKNPMDLIIAQKAAEVLIATGKVKNGFSFQAGSGGASLAVCKFLRSYMIENEIKGSFASGGITAYLVELLEEGLFDALLDTQTFDGAAADSLVRNKNHIEMSASMYANPHNKSCVAHGLDLMILSCTEIDVNFNINSLTASTGVIMGALGGAPDTAAGADITVVVSPSMRSRLPIVLDKVTNVVTPGDTIDVLVTERGVCVNPNRPEVKELLVENGIEVRDIKDLQDEIISLTKVPNKNEYEDKIVGVIEYRDGTVIDVIRQVK
ncbi:MAG: citrate lyase subunit alpha [Lachnospirales bacterium]